MKIILFGNGIPRKLQMEYLKRKNIPYWLYEYREDAQEYVKVEAFQWKLYEREDYISLVDKGDRYESKRNNGYWTEGAYHPSRLELRYDETMISILEEDPCRYPSIRIKEIDAGKRYRFIIDEFGDDMEIEVLEDEDWLIAR